MLAATLSYERADNLFEQRERAREKAEKEAAEKKAAEAAATGKNDADKKDGESSPKQKSDKGSTSPSGCFSGLSTSQVPSNGD